MGDEEEAEKETERLNKLGGRDTSEFTTLDQFLDEEGIREEATQVAHDRLGLRSAVDDPVFQVLKQATIKNVEDLFEISQLAATAWSKGEEVLVTVETREKKIKNDITDRPAEQSNNG